MIRNTALLCAALCAIAARPLYASDLLLLNGHVYTADSERDWAEAIAISGTRIDAVGTNKEIAKHREADTRIIDLHQRTVIPGIVDSHAHMWLGALALHGFNLATPEIYIQPKDEEALVEAIQSYARSHPEDAVLFGRVQFHNDASHALLDRAVADRPIVIHSPTEHSMWVNGKALELAGITAQPLDDPALERFIVRDAESLPTGVLREGAMALMTRALPELPLEKKLAWLRDAAHYLNSYGITSVTNATGSLEQIKLYDALRDRGELTVRTRTAFGTVSVNHTLSKEFLTDLDTARTEYDDHWVSANLVKFFADGAGGPPLYEPAVYEHLVTELDKRGYQIMTHALSPVGVHMVLDGYEAAIKANGPRDRRFRLEHAISVTANDVPRIAELGVIVSMQPGFCCFDDRPNARTNVFQTFLKTGAALAFGSDWPCTFPPDPFDGIQESVLREQHRLFSPPDPTAPAHYVTPEQRLTVEQAVDAYTRGGAYASFHEDYLGTLEAGKEADLVVLTQDIFTVPPEQIGNTQAVMTMVGGRVVFDQMR